MRTPRFKLFAASLLAALSCGRDVEPPRDDATREPERVTVASPKMASITEVVDWEKSAVISIGIERFRGSPPPDDVVYASDDATDVAYAFAKELRTLVPLRQILLILAGRPRSRTSAAHLLELRNRAHVVLDGEDDFLTAETIYELIREQAKSVGKNGVLVLSIATHGHNEDGEHVLLTPDASAIDRRGLVLNTILQSIPDVERLLLFVDACRESFAGGGKSAETAMSPRLFENLKFRGDYAIFVASEPHGYAQSIARLENGAFTWCVIDALRGLVAKGTDGYVTPSALQAHLNVHVRELTHGSQRPEGRFNGLADLPLIPAGDLAHVATIEYPRAHDRVKPEDDVRIRVVEPDLFATVLICPIAGRRCWATAASPIGSRADQLLTVSVPFGDAGTFHVYVAITSDPTFLRGEKDFDALPIDRRADRIVRWLGPVDVIVEEGS